MLWSMKESIENTEITTIVLVIAILLIVYRSPGLVLVPLAAIGVSYFVSLNLIALVAQWAGRHPGALTTVGRWLGRQQFDFQVFKTTQIFIVVILFGAATDYCLFLIARYREELERGLEPRAALEEALGQTGHALTASAMTTILGLGAMIFADFGKYRSGGPTIAMSLIVALAACMTVAPALLRAMGRGVFWPFGVGVSPARLAAANGEAGSNSAEHLALEPRTRMGRFWTMLARQIVAHPGVILVGSFVLLAVSRLARPERADYLRHAGRAQSQARERPGHEAVGKAFSHRRNGPHDHPGPPAGRQFRYAGRTREDHQACHGAEGLRVYRRQRQNRSGRSITSAVWPIRSAIRWASSSPRGN